MNTATIYLFFLQQLSQFSYLSAKGMLAEQSKLQHLSVS